MYCGESAENGLDRSRIINICDRPPQRGWRRGGSVHVVPTIREFAAFKIPFELRSVSGRGLVSQNQSPT